MIELGNKRNSGEKVQGWVKMFKELADVMEEGGSELKLLGYLINKLFVEQDVGGIIF